MSLISICIPTFNGEKYLQEALDSVKVQTYRDIEVVISDDNSQDATLAICENFKEEVSFPVSIYHHSPSGIGDNWNNCLKYTKGDYVKFLFQDDVLLPECVEKQLIDLQKSKCKIVCCGRLIIDENSLEVTKGDWLEHYGDLQSYLHLSPDIDLFLFKKKHLKQNDNYIYNVFGEPDSFLFHRSIFNEIGFFNNKLKQIIDLEFSYRILKRYPILIERNKYLKFRIHNGQESVKNLTMDANEYVDFMDWLKLNFFAQIRFKEKIKYIVRLLKITCSRYRISMFSFLCIGL